MPFVDVIRQKDDTKNVKNLLFLGDGFAAADKDLFDWTVEEVTDRLFRLIKPFDLPGVAEKFNIFSAFTPSPSSGISCSVPIDNHGDMDPSGPNRLTDKPSQFLLTYTGGAHITTKPFADEIIVDFVASLSHPFENPADSALPDCWDVKTVEGKDKGLVVVLVNDDVRGGTALTYSKVLSDGRTKKIRYAAVVTLGRDRDAGFNIFDFSLPPGDHTPIVATWPRNRIPFNQITDVVAHELAHSHFQLNDEYVNDPFDPTAGTRPYPDTPNITSDKDAKDATGNYTNVKWKDDMLPAVRAYVETTGPLRRDAQCAGYVAGQLVETSDVQAPAPPQFASLIALPSRIIGLYEGAHRQPCGVFRPAGTCKMRNTSYEEEDTHDYVSAGFCYVCKKAIITAIDPTLVPALRARDYPR